MHIPTTRPGSTVLMFGLNMFSYNIQRYAHTSVSAPLELPTQARMSPRVVLHGRQTKDRNAKKVVCPTVVIDKRGTFLASCLSPLFLPFPSTASITIP